MQYYYIYIGHLTGESYVSQFPPEELYCDTCGDSDLFISEVYLDHEPSAQEILEMIKDQG